MSGQNLESSCYENDDEEFAKAVQGEDPQIQINHPIVTHFGSDHDPRIKMQGLAFYSVVDTTGFYDYPFPGHRVKIGDLEPDDDDGGNEHTVSIELYIPPDVLEHEERSFVEEVLPPILKREFPDFVVEGNGVLYKNEDTQKKIVPDNDSVQPSKLF